ncbi:MAG TPA: hypothetical protein VGN69_06505 [Solirubrobacteraceae bacterium]|jgi:hypothetical protein|nr:hypothetical protein [Solirubrobacteraceae bacterium]
MSARDRLVVLALGVAALLAAAWFGLLAPQRQLATRAGQELSAAQARRADAMSRVAAAEQARTGFTAAVRDVSMLSRAVPSGQGVPALLQQLEATAQRNHVDFRSVRTGDPAATGGAAAPTSGAATPSPPSTTPTGAAAAGPAPSLPAQALSLIFAGNFLNLERFLDAVNHYTSVQGADVRVRGRLLSLRDVHLAPAQRGAGQMEATVAVTAYSLPPGQSPSELVAALRPAATPAGTSTVAATRGGATGPSTGTAAVVASASRVLP